MRWCLQKKEAEIPFLKSLKKIGEQIACYNSPEVAQNQK